MKKLLLSLITVFVAVSLMAQYNVTFSVDISGVEGFNPDTTAVYLSGDFAGWAEPGSDPNFMFTVTADPNIYDLTMEFADGENAVMYKYFLVYNDVSSWDYGEWTGDPNRVAVFTGETTLNDVYGAKPSVVTFNVDMSGVEFGPDTTDIYISGSFAGWAQPGSVMYWKMTPDATIQTTYSIAATIQNGEQQYKYFMVYNGEASWDHGEWTGDPNRVVTTASDTTFNDIWSILNPGINDITAGPIMSAYPNPCQSFINVNFFESATNIDKVEIYSITGAVIQSIDSFSNEMLTINTSELTNGLYFIAVYNKQGVQTVKFVKE